MKGGGALLGCGAGEMRREVVRSQRWYVGVGEGLETDRFRGSYGGS